jgi:serine/threonine protein phosphatase PrpC
MSVGRTAGLSDPGRKRRRNEDAYVLQPPLFAVADGMGGAQAGEVASRLAIEALKEHDSAGEGVERVAALVQAANRRIWERAGEDASAQGMGTTMTLAFVEEAEVAIGHVGDSRAYRIRDGEVEQLTDDHSLVGELMRSGKLSPEEAEAHPQRSVITRALGTDPDVDVDTFSVDARPGDVFLICSDGLTTMVDEEAILEEVERNRGDLDGAAKALVRRANRGGGEDNITVVFFEIAEATAEEEHTAVLAPPEAEPEHAEEDDTLDELDDLRPLQAPRAVDTMVVPPEQAAALRAEPNPLDRTAKRVLVTVLIVLMLAALAVVVYWWGLAS